MRSKRSMAIGPPSGVEVGRAVRLGVSLGVGLLPMASRLLARSLSIATVSGAVADEARSARTPSEPGCVMPPASIVEIDQPDGLVRPSVQALNESLTGDPPRTLALKRFRLPALTSTARSRASGATTTV